MAEKFSGEVVNYDSVQLYRGFDIGSAKLSSEERRGVPHHLLDALDPSEDSSAGDYARRARVVLEVLRKREKTPVLVGGSGFYLRAVLDGLFEGPERDRRLRERLEAAERRRGSGYLHRVLRRLDPEASQRIHANDVPKVVRALEVRLVGGERLVSAFARNTPALEGFQVVRIGLDPERSLLHERINRRARLMFEGGLLREVEALLASGVDRGVWAFGSLGYRQALAVVEGRMGVEAAVEETALRTRQYAKRQLTWFRRQEPETNWIHGLGSEERAVAEALRVVELTRSAG